MECVSTLVISKNCLAVCDGETLAREQGASVQPFYLITLQSEFYTRLEAVLGNWQHVIGAREHVTVLPVTAVCATQAEQTSQEFTFLLRQSRAACPLYPRKRTFAHAIGMSALGQ